MPVCHERSFVFVHVPKTGGTSLRQAMHDAHLELEWEGETTVDHQRRYGIFRPWLHHIGASDLRRILGPSIWTTYFKFSFVRNPWDRLVSVYHHQQALYVSRPELRMRWPEIADRFERTSSFVEWVRTGIYVESQASFLTDTNRQILVDFLGRFEALEHDFAFLRLRLGGIPVSLPHLLRSQRKPYSHYYDDETKAMVARHFEDDIDLFGYTFQD
jgi:hypothetical protein